MSGKFKKKEWTDIHQKKYDWLYNYVKTIHPTAKKDNYIDIYKRQLLKIVNDNKAWGNGSKEGIYFMIARWLYNIQDRYSKTYSDAGFNLLKESKEKEGENELDEKEKINYRPHIYFTNLLQSIDPSTINTQLNHYKYLLLNMLVYQAPLRTSFYNTAKIIRTIAENNGTDNFILINRRGKIKVSYIVNKDKASNYKLYNMNKNLAKIDLDDGPLEILINNSFVQYPRTYLFEINNKPVSQETILKWLRDESLVSGITIDIMRSSYITWFYENNHNYGAKDKLSKVMRHSVDTASRNYLKVFELENEPTQNPEYNLANVKLELLVKQLQEQIQAYTNKSIVTDETKHFKKKRRDILYNLNSKGREPRQDTLDKYQIKLNPAGTKYI